MIAPRNKHAKTLPLPDGSTLELREPSIDTSRRNVYHVGADRRIIWQIPVAPGRHPQSFADIYFKPDGSFWAYSGDGWEYRIDLATGAILGEDFLH